jgi:Fe-S-cluster-containing dehydrogenase component/CRP-like cAMP-binding protein
MPALVAQPTRWPEAVWDAPALRGLDGRARAELEAAGRLRRLAGGELVYGVGAPADSLYVVLEGICALVAVRRGEAHPSILRKIARGEVFGEEAVPGGARRGEARCEEPALVAELPLSLLRRAFGRAGGELAARYERAWRRAATADLLHTASVTRAMPEADLELLLDAVRYLEVPRGEHVYREGDEAKDAYLVAEGLVQVQSEDERQPRIEAYLSRGDLFGADELVDGSRRRVGAVAAGHTHLLVLPREALARIGRRVPEAIAQVGRVRVDALPAHLDARAGRTTAHVFQDLYRMRVARSLLVIDQDACVRCGHCAWSCASTHADGISRLVRRGDKVIVQREAAAPGAVEGVVARVARLASEVEWAPLLVPNSCQHCKNPSCMIDCPTAAIGRDARGEVFIREELCTGCGSCARACPWDNIQIAPRASGGPSGASAEVAVKCDLCAGAPAGPACVAACPTQAIARIDPNVALVELRATPRGRATLLDRLTRTVEAGTPAMSLFPRRLAAAPWVIGAALAAVGAVCARLSPWASGVSSGLLVTLLVAYAGVKRSPRLLARVPSSGMLGRALYVAHLAFGVVAVGVMTGHSRAACPPSVAGALTVLMALSVATGILGAVAAVVLPPRLARLERGSVLPEELASVRRELDDRIFARLSGRSEVVKTLYGRVLRPYRSARAGALLLALSGRRLREEERALTRATSRLLGGRASERLDGLDELVRLVVERRAVGSVRLLTVVLRGWLPVHLAACAGAAVLLVAHVLGVLAAPR